MLYNLRQNKDGKVQTKTNKLCSFVISGRHDILPNMSLENFDLDLMATSIPTHIICYGNAR